MTAPMSAPDRQNRPRRRGRPAALTAVVAVAGLALLAACGDGDDSSAPVTEEPSTAAATTTEPPVATTTDPPTTTAAPTTEVPTTAVADAPKVLDQTKILVEGKRYVTDTVALGVAFEFTATQRARWTVSLPGLFGIAYEADGDQPLVVFNDLSTARVYRDPFGAFVFDDAALVQATDDVPEDVLAWFAALPGVTAGTITDTTLLGLPARAMTYEIGDLTGAQVCNPSNPAVPCLLALYQASGVSTVYVPGDTGSFYVVNLGGREVLVDVADEPDAADLLASFEVVQ